MAGAPRRPVAALDCGTNSTRLLVLDPHGTALVREMRITRLGRGVDATHRLAPEALERTLVVLRDYRKIMESHDVGRARLVATSAVRDAANGADFIEAAADAVGVSAELLSGEAEGRLAHAGATADLPPGTGDDVVVDVGGGSTELIVGRRGSVGTVSMDLGCVRLSERYLQHDPPRAEEIAGAVGAIALELDRAVSTVPALRTLRAGSRLIGVAGTVSTLVALDRGLATYDRRRIHHAVLTGSDVARWCQTLGGEPAAARLGRPGMEEGREDVILGGALVLREVMRRLGFAECLESESDILDGIAAGLL